VFVGWEMSPNSGDSRWFLFSKLLLLTLVALSLTTTCKAQDKVEIFGGYSYLHASIQVGQSPCGVCALTGPPVAQHTNLNGWEFSGQYKFLPFLGVVADFNGNYGTLDNEGARIHSFLFGPQVSLPARVSPFAHALFGVAKESQDPIPLPPACPVGIPACGTFFSLGPDHSFASAVGAGIDIKAIPFLSIRLVQVDYLRTQLHGATQNQPRISAGVVFHF